MNLRQGVATPRDLLRELDEPSVLIADELTPSLAAQLDWTQVRGFATDAGSRTYHTAILARSLDVPAVVGLHDASGCVQAGQLVVIDGTASEVIVDPTDGGARARGAAAPTIAGRRRRVDAERARPAATADGVRIRLEANIEFPDDLAARALRAAPKASGCTARSSCSPARRATCADEDAQYADLPRHARRHGAGAGHGPDLRRRRGSAGVATDGRRSRAAGSREDERGSRQGLRGLRLSLTRPELFRTQLRALLRAARARPAAHHVSVRLGRRAAARGAARWSTQAAAELRAGAASRAARCRSA